MPEKCLPGVCPAQPGEERTLGGAPGPTSTVSRTRKRDLVSNPPALTVMTDINELLI